MQTLLVLNVSPQVEEDLIDYLLQADGVSGFTAQTVYGHGPEGSMTLAEQVTGRRKRLQASVLLSEEYVAGVLAGLASQVGGDIVWWQQPVSASGRI
jgi:hypothetical protein